MVYAIAAALLFGASAPLAKLLLPGWGEVRLAGALYLASGSGLLLVRALVPGKVSLRSRDLAWLSAAIATGGVAAPILLLFGLRFTTGYAGALLLNLEVVFTVVLAILFFQERISRRESAYVPDEVNNPLP